MARIRFFFFFARLTLRMALMYDLNTKLDRAVNSLQPPQFHMLRTTIIWIHCIAQDAANHGRIASCLDPFGRHTCKFASLAAEQIASRSRLYSSSCLSEMRARRVTSSWVRVKKKMLKAVECVFYWPTSNKVYITPLLLRLMGKDYLFAPKWRCGGN